jgi:hypothetical protein
LDEASLLVSNESDTLPDEADEPCDEADEAELAASAGIEAVSARPTRAAASGERAELRRGMGGLQGLNGAGDRCYGGAGPSWRSARGSGATGCPPRGRPDKVQSPP